MTGVSPYGLPYVFLGERNTSGYLSDGFQATASAAGDSFNMYEVNGILNAPFALNPPEFSEIFDNDGINGTVTFPIGGALVANLATNTIDKTLINKAQSTLEVTYGTASGFPLGRGDYTPLDMVMVACIPGQVIPGAASKWYTFVCPYVEVTPTGGGYTRQGVNIEHGYYMAIQFATIFPWGVAVSTANNGTTKLPFYLIEGDYPVMLSGAIGDASALVVNLPYTPFEDSANAVQVWVDGTPQTYTTDFTINTSAKTVTFTVGSPPATDSVITVMTHFLESEIS